MTTLPRNAAGWFSDVEDAQLRRLVDQAFDLRDGPYFFDAAAAIVAWRERTYPDRLERHAEGGGA